MKTLIVSLLHFSFFFFFFEVYKHRLSRDDFNINFNIRKPDFKSGAEYISFSFKFQFSNF